MSRRLGSETGLLPWFPRHPNLACTNEATPYGEIPEAIRPESERYARVPRTLAHSKGEGHAAQTQLSQHPVGFRTPESGRRAQGHRAPTQKKIERQ